MTKPQYFFSISKIDVTIYFEKVELTSFSFSTTEFAYTLSATEKCDVYSFGVVAMETIMGKHLRELISSLSNPSIQNMLVKDLLDSHLLLPVRKDAQDINLVVVIALSCLCSKPNLRPSM